MNPTIVCSILIAVLSAATVSTGLTAEPPAGPKSFTASIGGFLGTSYHVEMRDGALTYTVSEPGGRNPRRETISPTAMQWREFQQALDDLNIWKWQSEYSNQ